MTTQVLIVHGQLPFAIKLKQTLERGAPFEVHPFTSVEAAVEYLTDHLQDIAVVDFTIVEYTGEQIIDQLRKVQPNIPIIAAPKLEAGKTRTLGLAGSLAADFTAQDLIKAINGYFARNQRPSLESPGATGLLSRLTKRSPAPPSSGISSEYGSMDEALNAGATNIFNQPPVAADDTPSGPPEDLDWVDESSKRESSFDEVLNQLPPDAPKHEAPKKGTSPFNDLVNSMRTEETHRPLPSRQQQLVEFILSGGTEALDSEPPEPQITPLRKPEPEPEPPKAEEPPAPPQEKPPDWQSPSELSEWLTSTDDPDLFKSKPRTVEPEPMPDWYNSTDDPDLFASKPQEEAKPDWYVSTASLEGIVSEAAALEGAPGWGAANDVPDDDVIEPEAPADMPESDWFAPERPPERPPEAEVNELEAPSFFDEPSLFDGPDRPETAPLAQFAPPPEPPRAAPEPPRSPLLTAFDRLSKEEPAPPDFEENGTVSDLVEGVQDRSFRNVLSILSGDESGEGAQSEDIVSALPGDFDVTPRRTPAKPRKSDDFLFDDEDQPTPARIILERTLQKTISGGTFSLEELLANIDAQLPLHRPLVQPLPSWTSKQAAVQDDAFMVREPEFLPEEMPEDFPDEATPVEPSEDLFADQTTIASRGQAIEQHPEALETEWLEQVPRSAEETYEFPDSLPEEFPVDATVVHQSLDTTVVHGVAEAEEAIADEAFAEESPVPQLYTWDEAFPEETPASGAPPVDDQGYAGEYVEEGVSDESGALWYDLPEQDFNTQFEMMAAFEVHGETGYASGALYTETSVEPAAPSPEPVPEPVLSEDDYIAQMALSLTDASLELTAEASLLARDKQIIAYTGRMPEAEIEELRDTIADDWDAAPGEARIRFITAPGSGKDYMLYSRRTEADFTLSLIFAGTTPLRDIRRQGQRLVEALASVPEAPATIPEAPAPVVPQVDDATRTPYACVWLLRDPAAHLDRAASQAVSAGLNVQMREQGWTIRSLQVHEDYVYLLADVPGEEPAYQIMRELKRRSAALAHAQNPTYTDNGLWADGYLVVTPGRDLDVEEIQQFINFERME